MSQIKQKYEVRIADDDDEDDDDYDDRSWWMRMAKGAS